MLGARGSGVAYSGGAVSPRDVRSANGSRPASWALRHETSGIATATPRTVRAINDRVALDLFLQHESLTRSKLAALSGLSKPTAAQLLSRLVQAGLVVAQGTSSGSPGPNAQLYVLNGAAGYAAAIEVDERRAAAAIADLAGHVLGELSVEADYSSSDDPVSSVRGLLADVCRRSGVRLRDLDEVVLGVPAAYDPASDQLRFGQHIPGWTKPDTLSRLRAALHDRLVVENDVKLAAIWERRHGAGRGASSFALVWVGTGLGLAADHGGVILTGANGAAGEIGYMRLGLRPSRGKALPPTFHDLVGPTAVEALARQYSLPHNPREAVAAARQDLNRGIPFLVEFARRLASALAPIIAVLDPELVVLAGPTCVPGGEVLVQLVTEELRTTSPFETRVAVSEADGSPVIHGALDAGLARLRAGLFAPGEGSGIREARRARHASK